MYAKNEVSVSYGSKVIGKVKVDNRQDKNNMSPIYQKIKGFVIMVHETL